MRERGGGETLRGLGLVARAAWCGGKGEEGVGRGAGQKGRGEENEPVGVFFFYEFPFLFSINKLKHMMYGLNPNSRRFEICGAW